MRIEKRKTERIKIKGGKAKCYTLETRGTYNILDISKQGVCLEHGRNLKNNELVTLKLQWAGLGKGRARGRVVRTGRKIGIQFINIDDKAESLIELLVSCTNFAETF